MPEYNLSPEQIQELIKSSTRVIKDCVLKNGAIVAANSKKPYYPHGAKNYRYVWIRDASYICLAAKILGIEIQEKFFDWCMKAEGWSDTGLFYEKYYVNGKKALYNFQPDQAGTLLLVLCDYIKDGKKNSQHLKRLIDNSADALCRIWEKDHFKLVTQDLWEERYTFPDFKENFNYSLAACSYGLSRAFQLIPNKNWLSVAIQMKERILSMNVDFFYRSSGLINDKRIDASLLGLVWPFKIVDSDDSRMIKTIDLIEKKIGSANRLKRYENDDYDGWIYEGKIQRNKGAGYWPLLNFWMSIYYAERGEPDKANLYYEMVLKDLRGKLFIPEQIFDNDYQISVSPLAWSHAMFVIATHKLGYVQI